VKLLTILFSCTFLILFACDHANFKNSYHVTSTETHLLFFSDEKNLYKEAKYYDALLEIKTKFPEQVSKMKVISSASDDQLNEQYNVKTFPTLLVVKDNKVVLKIDGNTDKKDIVDPIIKVLSN
jgi:Thioredoxin